MEKIKIQSLFSSIILLFVMAGICWPSEMISIEVNQPSKMDNLSKMSKPERDAQLNRIVALESDAEPILVSGLGSQEQSVRMDALRCVIRIQKAMGQTSSVGFELSVALTEALNEKQPPEIRRLAARACAINLRADHGLGKNQIIADAFTLAQVDTDPEVRTIVKEEYRKEDREAEALRTWIFCIIGTIILLCAIGFVSDEWENVKAGLRTLLPKRKRKGSARVL